MENQEHITNENEKNIAEFQIDNIVKTTYKKIAEWHNDEANVNELTLKHLTFEIIDDVCGEVFKHLGISYTPAIYMNEETKNKVNLEKDKNKIVHKNINSMTDEEILRELENRKKNKI